MYLLNGRKLPGILNERNRFNMCHIVPNSIYQTLLKTGDSEQKALAAQALTAIKTFAYSCTPIFQQHLQILNEGKPEAEEEAVNRSIYDAQNGHELPGKLVRSEGQSGKNDIAVSEAYDGSGTTWEFFHKVFGRNSIDNAGMKLISTVHYGKNFGNAFWNGRQMTYGDGDGRIFNRFTAVIDVIGHEISHGVTERTAGLEYYSQPGALNEHFSDVFGSLIKQYSLKQTADKADWLIGQGLFTNKIKARALRDMRNPGTAYDDPKIGKDPQPNHMDKYYDGAADNQGVHINSSIPNKAFCMAAINIGGYAWEKIGKVWYKVLSSELKQRSNFNNCAIATVNVAGKMFGAKSVEQKAIKDGWEQVGIKPKF